ncbi:MAG: TatD family hydrolase [Deltaproteobacteria bacterium]|nr:TatD family hydrolase [Deltaproteobacteria bacterium]
MSDRADSAKVTAIDGHAHLAEMEDVQSSLDHARNQGVEAVIAVGMDVASNEKTFQIAKQNPGFVYPAIGYHPWSIRKRDIGKTINYIEKEVGRAIALGEVGLDFKINVRRDLQEEVLRALAALASHHDKPLILHCRHAYERVFSIAQAAGVKSAVFHWYVDTLDLLREIVKAGYVISATPALQYSPPHQAAVRAAPIEHILLETDCPVEYQQKASRPGDVMVTLREVARLKGLSPESVARQTTENARGVFRL